MYSCTLFLTSALEGDEGSASCPGRTLLPRKTWYPFYGRLVGPQDRSQVWKISPPPGFYRRTVQPVDSRYTDYATRPTDSTVQLVLRASLRDGLRAQNLPVLARWVVRSESITQITAECLKGIWLVILCLPNFSKTRKYCENYPPSIG